VDGDGTFHLLVEGLRCVIRVGSLAGSGILLDRTDGIEAFDAE
jgi:hypothetical protein